jgi:hypothetical protein
MYALFKDDKQISKAHSTQEAAAVEAYERKLVIDWGTDFPGDKPGRTLLEGYEIKNLEDL